MQNLKPTKNETAIFDKQKGYYLVKDAPQGSSAKHLLLIRPEDLKDDPAEILSTLKVSWGNLPLLGTGHGVKIGDTPQQVTSKIGLPTQHDVDIDGEPEITGNGTYHYSYPGGHLNGWSYEAWYEFRKGKLRTISIAIQKGIEVAG